MYRIDDDLLSIQEARVLVEKATLAQKDLSEFSQKELNESMVFIAEKLMPFLDELAILCANETEYGNAADKLIKNTYVCTTVVKHLEKLSCVGIIKENTEEKTMDIGVPIGVIAATLPATSPVSTALYKIFISIKSGNSIIFSAHPRAKNTCERLFAILKQIMEKTNLPCGCIDYLKIGNEKGLQELRNHPHVSLVFISETNNVDFPNEYHKNVLFAGEGSGPAFIERTANIQQAVSDIIQSKIFDYGTGVASEQSVIVDGPIHDIVKKEFEQRGAYFMTEEEANSLRKLLYVNDDCLNEDYIGKSAGFLAKSANFIVPKETVLLIAEQKYVSYKNPYSRKKLSPVLSYFVEKNWMNACEKCIELLLSEGKGHTLVIHSQDENIIREFALKKPVSRVLVNTPATFGGIGLTTNLFPSMTLGNLHQGGLSTDNISPYHLVNIRKVGYGVRNFIPNNSKNKPVIDEYVRLIQNLIAELNK